MTCRFSIVPALLLLLTTSIVSWTFSQDETKDPKETKSAAATLEDDPEKTKSSAAILHEDPKETNGSGATLKGKLAQNEKQEFQVELTELKTALNQQVQLPPPPLPDDWKDRTVEQRQTWAKEFDASERGKEFAEERKRILDAAPYFELQVEPDGTFTVYDVPFGTYGLRGWLEKSVSGKSYVFEVFGQIEVGKGVDEILLDPISVTNTRLLKAGEAVPAIDLETFDGKKRIENKLLAGHNVLFSFWSLKSPPSLEFSRSIQEAYGALKETHGLYLVSICVDSDRDEALKHVQENTVRGLHGFAGSWDHEIVNEFGVRSIPALFLAGADGTIKMTNGDFQAAYRLPDAKLAKIVVDGIEGKKAADQSSQPNPAEQPQAPPVDDGQNRSGGS